MSNGLFWSALAAFVLLMVYLEYRFRPRPESKILQVNFADVEVRMLASGIARNPEKS